MNAILKPQNLIDNDYHVADLKLADWGNKEIKIAETEMPGLMAIRQEFAVTRPLKGARITGSLHMTIQTAVLIQTLEALGAQVRWASCNIFSTQDHAAAAIAASGTPVFAVKGETLEDYWDYTHRIFEWKDGGLNRHMQRTGDARALERAGNRKLLPNRHQARHFGLGNLYFLVAPGGQLKVGNVIVVVDQISWFENCVHKTPYDNLKMASAIKNARIRLRMRAQLFKC